MEKKLVIKLRTAQVPVSCDKAIWSCVGKTFFSMETSWLAARRKRLAKWPLLKVSGRGKLLDLVP